MTIRVQHSFQGMSGTAADQYVNVFHINRNANPDLGLEDVATVIKSFYSTPLGSASFAVRRFMSGISDTDGARIKMYDLTDTIPRAAIYDETYNPGDAGVGVDTIPSEVAVCLSYKATAISGVPASRLRGRIYIGPLSTHALNTSGDASVSRPHVDCQISICQAGAATHAALEVVGYDWVVYSPTASNSHKIVSFWVDDAWDTQRRRGEKPTSRTTANV